MELVMLSIRSIRCISLTARLAIAATIGAAVPVVARADDAIRQSWEDFAKDPRKVASLRKAVAVMKARNSADRASADYRKSWEYWANIHGYYGPQSRFGTVAVNRTRVPAQYRHFFDGISDATPPDQVARDVWANCQHGTSWFFAWHRLFLLYFEKQLQDAAGDATLRLPYWDYTSPTELGMPADFLQPTYTDAAGTSQPNPLYEKRRAAEWEQGGATLDSNSTDIDSALDETRFSGYQSDIEQNVHGYVHCSVAVACPVPDMGAVPYSSNDPIFWLHHANIDRLWSCWSNMPGRQNPSDAAFVGKSFSFVDTNGQKVTKKVGDLFNGTLVDYKYEKETSCARATVLAFDTARSAEPPSPRASANVTAEKFDELLAQPRSLNAPTQPVSLTAETTKVKVELRTDNDMRTLNSLALEASPTRPTRTRLILGGITFDAPPGVQLYVFLEDSADPSRREYAGTVSFFAAEPGDLAHDHDDAAASARQGITREFDVTRSLRKLSGDKGALSDVTVAFVATSGRRGGAESAEINSAAGLTVKSIDFQVSAVK
jgi:hypothetical protein